MIIVSENLNVEEGRQNNVALYSKKKIKIDYLFYRNFLDLKVKNCS